MRRSLASQLVAGILVNSVYEMKNYPINLVNTVLSPLSFLVVIDFVSRGALIGQAIEGGLIMSMFQSGMSLQGDISHLKNDFKLQDMLVSSPASPAAYVVGMAASEIIYTLPALAILVILGAIYIHPGAVQALELTGALLLMFLTSITIGFMFATLSSDIVQSFAWSRLLSTIFTAITPVYYPITYIPLPFRYLAYLSPTTYAAEIMQNAAGSLQLSAGAVATDWAVLGGLTAILLVVVSRNARWKEV
ncbi:MAG TPA: ABC transporter permease [Nitrososphaerales archaeon]|nr:ABC transporter permease [Nitrososphaerales archaeon]